MRAIGYIRVSTDEQATSGISLDAQRHKVGAYAELHGLDLVSIEVDAGASGKSLDRPGLARALTYLESGQAEALVIVKLDWLSRSVGDWDHLIKRYFGDRAGFQLMSVTDSIDTRTAAGRLVLNVIMSVAQWERETTVERTRGALDFKRSRSERIGQVPYGFDLADNGKTLVENIEEQAVIDTMQGWRALGWSFRRIAQELTDRGVSPKNKAGRWAHTGVASILNRLVAVA